MSDIRKIKQLQSQLQRMIADADVLKIEYTNKQREYNQKIQAMNKLKEAIELLYNDKDVKISEHAIIRYLERVKGINIAEIEKEILTDDVLLLINKLGGNGKYPVKDFQIVMRDFTITTIL